MAALKSLFPKRYVKAARIAAFKCYFHGFGKCCVMPVLTIIMPLIILLM
jgi:hypothetical protein